MVTKAELETELALLRAQNENLRSQVSQGAEPAAPPEDAAKMRLPDIFQNVLDEHGFDGSNAEAMGRQLMDELESLQKDHPLVTLLGVFALGCVVGRAFK